MTYWIAPVTYGDRSIEVYDRDVSDLLADRERANARVAQGLDDGIGLGLAYDVQSQIESELAECRRLTLDPDEARALSSSLLTAASRATWPPIDYSATGRD